MKTGTPLQAIKFANKLNNGMGENFLRGWADGRDVSHWLVTLEEVRESKPMPPAVTFETFCKLNPDEPERADGRKLHYGTGRQPLDDIIDAGWGGAFCAGNVLKYLRRNKQMEDSCVKARWYWRKLNEITYLTFNGEQESRDDVSQLMNLLSEEEMKVLSS